MKCIYCEDLSETEKEHPDEIHHGSCISCGECGAEYYVEWGGKTWAKNNEALTSHPELKLI